MVTTGIVYLVKNTVNGKSYVGMSSRTLHERWYDHVQNAKRGSMLPLHCAIRKYGASAFELSVLQECSTLELPHAEIEWISRLETMVSQHGYNVAMGGNGCLQHDPDVREKIRQSMIGGTLSTETREKIAKSLRGRKLSAEHRQRISKGLSREDVVEKRSKAMMGKQHSDVTKHQISQTLLKIFQDNPDKFKARRRPIKQIDMKTQQVIVEYHSLLEAEQQTGISRGNISACARGKIHHAGGFKWRYVDDVVE